MDKQFRSSILNFTIRFHLDIGNSANILKVSRKQSIDLTFSLDLIRNDKCEVIKKYKNIKCQSFLQLAKNVVINHLME